MVRFVTMLQQANNASATLGLSAAVNLTFTPALCYRSCCSLVIWPKRLSRDEATCRHKGECFCGAVHVEVSGEPEAMGYCHCRSCRSWSGGPVNAFTLWKPNAVRVTAGAEQVATFQKTEASQRQYCKKCGGHLMTNHPALGLVDVFAATLPTLQFSPGVHVNYAETVLPMKDGLPKLKDFPKEFGGSGEVVPE
jgi:hypothetical protein